MNVLVYAGKGVSPESLHHIIHSLRLGVGTHYDIKLVGPEILAKDPWEDSCRLLVLPGGRDLPFTKDLSGQPIERIRRYVLGNGRLLGICAGAYFSCTALEFEKNSSLEITGKRELALCPAIAKGPLYPGFQYENDESAVVAPITIDTGEMIKTYYYGGCWFDFTNDPHPLKFTTLATYSERDNLPAIVCGSKEGESSPSVILSGVHIEYDPAEYAIRRPNSSLISPLTENSSGISNLWHRILSLLGLSVSPEKRSQTLPSPTPLYMFVPDKSIFQTIPKDTILECEQDQFKFIKLNEPLQNDSLISISVTNETSFIDPSWTFSPARYYSFLTAQSPVKDQEYLGKTLIYGEYINSTHTILVQNPRLAATLPNGTIILAGDQLAGKGRGQNTWLSSKGCLQFNMVLHHKDASNLTLIQYLVGLAMVEAILTEPDYQDLPVKLKWPNDLYTGTTGDNLKKLGGLIVNSQSFEDEFLLLIGFGTNVYDTPWTRSLNDLIEEYNSTHGTILSPWTKELLLARFLAKFAELYRLMLHEGFPFELYYSRWLHSGQVVFLESEQSKARIEGIDKNGFLVARSHTEGLLGLLDSNSSAESISTKSSSKAFLLQPDGNSFDMMKNLIRRK